MKHILAHPNVLVMVDDEDYENLKQYEWSIDNQGYAKTNIRSSTTKSKHTTIKMHRMLAGPFYDHKDRNPINNQKENLRPSTRSQNGANRGPQKNNKTGYKGVTYNSRRKKFIAQIRFQGKLLFLGRFDTDKEAALVYNKKASALFGEFAYANPL